MINIGDKKIGPGYPAFLIAELSANHNKDIDIAISTIRAAKKAGADAIKLQTYTPDTITIDCRDDYFKLKHNTIWDGRYLYDLYKEAHTPWEWHKQLFEIAHEEGLICFSSPFDKTAVDFLENLNVPAYKISSFEIQDIPLIEYVASKDKPVIISTGIAELGDIQLAVESCRNLGNNDIILLKCTSSYPAPIELANLRTIPNLKDTFNVESGLSDHSLGILAPITAVALGATVIEKHFILDKKLGGPDSQFSLDPVEFTEMVDAVRLTEKAIGKVDYTLSDRIKKSRELGRSLFVIKDVKKGERVNEESIRSIRPGYGLHPKYYNEILGRTALVDISRGTPLSWKLIE